MTRPFGPPDPLATARLTLVSYKGGEREHWLDPANPARTLCGKRAHQTRPPEGGAQCATCRDAQARRKRAKARWEQA